MSRPRQSEEGLHRLLEATRVIPWEADFPDRRYTYLGFSAPRLLGYPLADWFEPGFWRSHVHPDDLARVESKVRTADDAPAEVDLEYRLIAAGGDVVWIRELITRDRGEDADRHFCGVMIEITTRKRAELLQAGITRVLESLARGKSLVEVLTELARTIDAQQTGMRSSILRLDESGTRLRHVAGPNLPDDYNQAIDGVEIGPSVGSCGTAAYRKERVVVTDIATDPLWMNYRDLAEGAGLGACWSQPVRAADGKVLGTFAIYYDHARHPTSEEISLIEQAAYLAGVALEHDASGEALRRNESALRESNDRIHYLAGRLITAQEDERRRLARELHDDLAQRMALVRIEMGNLEKAVSGMPADVGEQLSRIRGLIGELAKDLHDLSRRLHPAILKDLGLVDALRTECEGFADREGIAVRFEARTKRRRFPEDASICLYRVLQEALRNIAKHASSSDASVRVEESNGDLVLQVEDSGVGIVSVRPKGETGVGLTGMRERVRIAAGSFEVGSRPDGGGTRIRVVIPLGGGPDA